MKTILCAAFLVIGMIVTFLFQSSKLETLRHEAHALEASVRAVDDASTVSGDRRHRNQAAGTPSEKSVERLTTMVNLSFQMLLNPEWEWAQHLEFEQIRNKMILDLVQTNHHSAFNILNQALEIPGISQDQRNRLIRGYVGIHTDADPLEALKLIELLPHYPESTQQVIKAYLRTAITSPGHAVAWFEEQSRKGNPITKDPEVIRASLTAQSRVDPTRAVSRMADLAEPEDIKALGFSVFQEFRNVSEHLAFAEALENEVATNPTSLALSEIRTQYVKALDSRLDDWPFEEAILLIDGCLTPEEKLKMGAPRFSDFEDAEKWAGWLADFEVADSKTHPVSSYVGSWAITDPAAAMNWLENLASGTARERGVIGFANFMAEKDPRNGLRLLNTLPESEERSNTIQRVRERWRKVDPAAEAEYTTELGEGN